jgi:hypothetical protein
MSKDRTGAEPREPLVHLALLPSARAYRQGWKREFRDITDGEIERLTLHKDERERDG